MKKMILGFLSVLSFLLIFSCEHAKKPVQLMIWGRTEEYRAVVGFVKKFNKIYPDIKVQILYFPNYQTKLLTMMSAGTPPDVMYMGCEDFPFYAAKDVFLDLTPMVKNDPDTVTPKFSIDDFYPQTVEPFIHEGKILGIPKDFSTMVVYYNKTMFDAAGVAYPKAGWTWNDFLDTAKKLTKQNPDTGRMQYGYVFESWSGYWMPWLRQNNGDLVSPDGKKWVLGKGAILERNAEAFQFLFDMMYKSKVAPTLEMTKESGSSELFETGAVAMATYGRWRCLQLQNVKSFEWDVAPLPRKEKEATTLFTVCYSIAKKTKRPEDSWKLVKFLVGETGQVDTAESALAIPSMKKYAESDHFLKTKSLPAIHSRVYLDLVPYAKVVPANTTSRQVNDIINRNLEKFFMKMVSAKDALTSAQKEIDEYIIEQDKNK